MSMTATIYCGKHDVIDVKVAGITALDLDRALSSYAEITRKKHSDIKDGVISFPTDHHDRVEVLQTLHTLLELYGFIVTLKVGEKANATN